MTYDMVDQLERKPHCSSRFRIARLARLVAFRAALAGNGNGGPDVSWITCIYSIGRPFGELFADDISDK